MEIDIFPVAPAKGIHRYISTALLGLVILNFIIGSYKIAERLIGEDNEILCLFVSILLFIGGYSVLILILHAVKQFLYSYFKQNRKGLNNRADQEDMDNYIIKHLEDIQKKLDAKSATDVAQRNVVPSAQPVQQLAAIRRKSAWQESQVA